MIILSPEREQELVDVLAESFTPEDLDYKVADPLGVSASERSAARDLKERARALVVWAKTAKNMQGLIETAVRGNPSSVRLKRFSESVGLSSASSDLVEVVRPALAADQEPAWLRGLVEAQRQVCAIKMRRGDRDESQQTGFLVGDDLVMTAELRRADEPGVDFTFAFDDLTLGPNRNAFVVITTGGVTVVRLERPIARELVQGTANVAVRARGWISPMEIADPAPESPVVIVQNAEGSIRVTADVHGLVRSEGHLFHYRTTTHGGSMGAPCFDEQWRLLGMHIGVDHDLNHGRTTASIVKSLREKGYRWDASGGVYRATMAMPPDRATPGSLDSVISGIASSIDDTGPWSDDVEDLDLPEADRWGWVEAAAVLATFDPATLKPCGTPSDEARVALLLESRQIGARWMLGETMRKAALKRLGARGDLANARAVNTAATNESELARVMVALAAVSTSSSIALAAVAGAASLVSAIAGVATTRATDAGDLVDAALGDLIAGRPPTADALRDPAALRALVTAIDWLDGAMPGLPDRDQLRGTLERATLLTPFIHLTQGVFEGRTEEMTALREYVDGTPDKPMFIHAPGGTGKSALLAHFVLENAKHDPMNATTWRPFVYLDFDRPDLDAMDLVGVLLAIVKQLGPQVPAITADALQLVETERKRQRSPRARRGPARKRQSLAQDVTPDRLPAVLEATQELFAHLSQTPIVMIFDTLEEVQFANPDAIQPLIQLVRDLGERVPCIRGILAGRIDPEEQEKRDPAFVPTLREMALQGLPRVVCETLLVNQLSDKLENRAVLAARLVEIVGALDDKGELRANPLSLRLAAEVINREAERATRVIDELDKELRDLVGDALVQGRLYERILGHVHDKRVEAIAHPGLALRRFTMETIRDVLAVPCGLGTIDDATAQELFDLLAKEVALVVPSTVQLAGEAAPRRELSLRPELRRIVSEDLARDTTRAEQRKKIHAAAVKFYERSSEPRDRAEEIYHRLALGEDPDLVDKRWITGIELFLKDAVGDLSPRANAYLANRVGGVAEESQVATATPTDWEVYAAKRAGDLLKFSQPQRALDLLATRTERLPTSKLHYVESIARRTLVPPDLEGAEAAAERAVAAAKTSSNADDLRDALEELVRVRRQRNDTAGVLRGLAELGNLGDVLGDDLVLLQSNVEGLEALAPTGGSERFSSSAVRVFNRLPDDLVIKAPELARRVAAQIGGVDPTTLQRVIKLVGFGALEEGQARELAKILDIPDASAREIASTARQRVTRSDLDSTLARRIANWLRPIVTPKPTR